MTGTSEDFAYPDDEWSSIVDEVGEVIAERRFLVERIAREFLSQPTPSALRRAAKAEIEASADLAARAFAFVDALRDAGFPSSVATNKGSFSIAAIEDFASIHQRIGEGRFADVPEGRRDPSRNAFLWNLCLFWRDDLDREVRASWDFYTGNSSGPMVRFLLLCANPVLRTRDAALLTPDSARSAIREFQKDMADRSKSELDGFDI